MLIYSVHDKENNMVKLTTVMFGFRGTMIKHNILNANDINLRHREAVKKLTEDMIYVTGTTASTYTYSGEYLPRSHYKQYIDKKV